MDEWMNEWISREDKTSKKKWREEKRREGIEKERELTLRSSCVFVVLPERKQETKKGRKKKEKKEEEEEEERICNYLQKPLYIFLKI